MNLEKEQRTLEFEYRGTEESREIEGYSIVWNSLSQDLGNFREQILPEAIEGVIEKSDIALLINHDDRRGILARCKKGKGSLRLNADEKGLHFETNAPKTALGDEALEYLRRGDATQCSFAFTVAEGGDSWAKQADGTYIRTISKFDRLFDCSILTCTPAYEATSVSCRSFDEFKAQEEAARLEEEARLQKEKEEQEAREAEEKAENLKKYYEALKDQYKDYLKKEN